MLRHVINPGLELRQLQPINAPTAEGRGIMTLCCRAVNDDAFNNLKLQHVVVAVATENRCAKKSR
jgi:RimJ/RimL family protein N-acetyltransferase